MFKSLRICVVCVLGLVALAGCVDNAKTVPVLDQNGQPTGQVVQQDQGHPFLAALGGSFLGNMLGNHFSRPAVGSPGYASAPPVVHHSTVVNKTVVNKTIVNQQVVKTSPSVPPPKPTTSGGSPGSRSSSTSSSSRSYSARSSSSYSSSRSFGGRR